MRRIIKKGLIIGCVIGMTLSVSGCAKNDVPEEPNIVKEAVSTELFDTVNDFLDTAYGYEIKGEISKGDLEKYVPEELSDLIATYDSYYMEATIIPDSVSVTLYDSETDKNVITRMIINEDATYWDISKCVSVMDDFSEVSDIEEVLMDYTDDASFIAFEHTGITNGCEFNDVVKKVMDTYKTGTFTSSKQEELIVIVSEADLSELGDSFFEQIFVNLSGDCEIHFSEEGEIKNRSGSISIDAENFSFAGTYTEIPTVQKCEEVYAIEKQEYEDILKQMSEEKIWENSEDESSEQTTE